MIKKLLLKTPFVICLFFMCQTGMASGHKEVFNINPSGKTTVLPSSVIMANGTFGGPGNEVCGGTFLDPGGTGNYSFESQATVTILPDVPGDGVCLDFTTFDLDKDSARYSYLYIYEGNSVNPSNLLMKVANDWDVTNTGNNFAGPGMVCSNGPITIKLDATNSWSGWEADILCYTPAVNIPTCSITAQGTANGSTSDVLYINSGDQVDLSALGELPNTPLNNDFNNGEIGNDWSIDTNTTPDFTNPSCVGGSSDGTTFFWMGVTNYPRRLQSKAFDLSDGGQIEFDLKFGIQGGSNPCEGPDYRFEGVYLQYSVDNINWTTIHYFFPIQTGFLYTGGSNKTLDWNKYTFLVPDGAKSTSTYLRWFQQRGDTSATDSWGLDNIIVKGDVTVPTITWDQGLGLGADHTVNPTSNTTYTATITDATGNSCQKSVYVIIGSPAPSTIDFDGTDDYISRSNLLSENDGATMMTWMKLDAGSDGGDIMGQGNYRMFVDGSKRLKTSITTPGTGGGTTSETYTLKMIDTDTYSSGNWRGGYSCPTNGLIDISVSGVSVSGGSVYTIYSGDSNPKTETFTVNIGDTVDVSFNGDGYGDEMQYEIYDSSGNLINSKIGAPDCGSYTTSFVVPGVVGPSDINLITPDSGATLMQTDKWVHVAAVYDGVAGEVKNYVNGELQWTDTGVGANLIEDLKSFEIGRNADTEDNYFEGSIYETRVYDIPLTENQIQEQVYQRVKFSDGKVHGEVIPKDIDGGTLNWSNLVAYYRMNAAAVNLISDTSLLSVAAQLHNMTTVQDTNAPLPYVANVISGDGKWTNTLSWEHGGVWDIPSKDWAIVQVSNNAKLITTESRILLGNIVDAGAEFSVETDKSLTITNYLKLDGHLDLVGESQLIQTTGSTFEPASLGYLERDQQGKSNIYSYNYWSSPVYPTGSSSNNALYSISNILKSGIVADNPKNITFTSAGYDGSTTGETMTVADYWIWKYTSQPDAYANWQHIRSTGEIKPGEGYTMKGTGAGIQNYVFTGKPTNGTIQHTINGGDIYLLGNPYASALDADQFIDDNVVAVDDNGDIATGVGASTGALYFWEHFNTNNSHILAQYEGGYATYNKIGGVIAVADAGVSSNGTGSIRPGRYVPVGQGFFVKATPLGGVVEFNNNQRVFEKEVTAAGSGKDYSIFTRTSNTNIPTESPDVEENITLSIQRLYFKFTNTDGFQRELLLGIKEGLADGLNYGYDAMLLDNFISDCSWLLNENSQENLVIQGIGSVYDNLQLPLHIKADKTGNFKFEVIDLSDIDSSTSVYLYDKELDSSFPLEAGVPVEFYLEEGVYSDRFKVVFKVAKIEEAEAEEAEEVLENIDTADNLVVFYNTKTQSIDITNTTQFSAKNISIHNVLGQQVVKMTTEFKDQNLITIPVSLATGAYVITFDYDNKRQVTKKLMIR